MVGLVCYVQHMLIRTALHQVPVAVLTLAFNSISKLWTAVSWSFLNFFCDTLNHMNHATYTTAVSGSVTTKYTHRNGETIRPSVGFGQTNMFMLKKDCTHTFRSVPSTAIASMQGFAYRYSRARQERQG